MPDKPCKWCQRPGGQCDCQDRIDCPRRGQVMHYMCGWCSACEMPMFMCLAEHWRAEQSAKET